MEVSMRVCLDGQSIDVPGARTLGELLEGIAPQIDPSRIVTEVAVDGRPADSSDVPALAAWRLSGAETVKIGTQTPADFARTRREDIARHLKSIAELLTAVARGFTIGETEAANRVLAEVSRQLQLVLELDRCVAALDGAARNCEDIAATIERIGSQLTDAERGRRWAEVAKLLSDELVPAIRSSAG
jgi:hypothetical protein